MNPGLEQFMGDIFDALYENPRVEDAMEQVLSRISCYFQASSACLVELQGDDSFVEHVYEWSKPDIRVCAGDMAGSVRSMFQGSNSWETVIYTALDPLSTELRNAFAVSGVRSLIASPFLYHGQLIGYILICDFRRDREDWKIWGRGDEGNYAFKYLTRLLAVFLQKLRQEHQMACYQKELEGSLKQSEEKVETAYEILDKISSGVVVLKTPSYDKLLPVYGNLGQYRMLRLERTAVDARVPDEDAAELESQYFDDAFAGVHPEDMERVRSAYMEGYKTGDFSVKKYRLLRGDGSYVWVNADLCLQETTPEYKLYYATYTDVTEEHELQMQLSRALEQQKLISSELEQASKAKTDFLSRMSHDIRTPMNAILGLAALARNELEKGQDVRSYLDKLEASGQFLMGLLNDILDISRIERNAVTLHLEPYDIEEFRQQVDALIVPQCRKKGIEFEFITKNLKYRSIMLDKLRFNQAVFNLLNNAVRYTPSGGRIEFMVREVEEREGRLHNQMVIRDNGIGMSRDFQEHMYEPFTQEGRKTADSDERSSGLGLTIVKSLVELMGGTIQVNSEIGKGTEFLLDVWVDMVSETEQPQASETDRDISIEGLHILLCEDNALNMEIAVYLLEEAGAVVDCAGNGREVLDRFRASEPGSYDAILMDIRMPVMDGLEAARNIRAMDRPDAVSVPIFAMTANAYDEDMKMSREAGMNEHLSKPVDAEVLYRTIWQYAGRK